MSPCATPRSTSRPPSSCRRSSASAAWRGRRRRRRSRHCWQADGHRGGCSSPRARTGRRRSARAGVRAQRAARCLAARRPAPPSRPRLDRRGARALVGWPGRSDRLRRRRVRARRRAVDRARRRAAAPLPAFLRGPDQPPLGLFRAPTRRVRRQLGRRRRAPRRARREASRSQRRLDGPRHARRARALGEALARRADRAPAGAARHGDPARGARRRRLPDLHARHLRAPHRRGTTPRRRRAVRGAGRCRGDAPRVPRRRCRVGDARGGHARDRVAGNGCARDPRDRPGAQADARRVGGVRAGRAGGRLVGSGRAGRRSRTAGRGPCPRRADADPWRPARRQHGRARQRRLPDRLGPGGDGDCGGRAGLVPARGRMARRPVARGDRRAGAGGRRSPARRTRAGAGRGRRDVHLRLAAGPQRRDPPEPGRDRVGARRARFRGAVGSRRDGGVVRPALVVLALAVWAAPAAAATCGSTAGVPAFTPAAQPVADEAVSSYLSSVDTTSTRVLTGVAGTSTEGRPIPFALVSSPRNLARLGAIAGRAHASRQGRAHAAGGPAIVWLAANVHGNEPSGTDADLQLLSELARGASCTLLDRLVIGFLPLQNPDGRAAGTRTNAAGFDLNRDWFARTQPETAAKLDLLSRYPPLAFADQHEEGGTSFFFPPDADPVHHEVPTAALRAMSQTIGPALQRAFERAGVGYSTGAGYDLFFMGYGDSATTTLFGAAGMTFEKGTDAPFARKVTEHHLAAKTLLEAVAAHRHALLRAWDRSWRQARAEGRRGQRERNATQSGAGVDQQVPRGRVYAYAWRADVAAFDAATLAARLRSVGVEVNQLRRSISVRAFHAYGAPGQRRRTLPAGMWVVTLAQTQKHWVEAMLGEDPYAAVASFYDAASWSNPLLMGLDGGAIRSRLPRGVLGPAVIPGRPGGPPFAGDSEGGAEVAMNLLAHDVPLARVPRTGAFVAPGDRAPANAVALRAPRVALLDGLHDSAGSPSPSSSWMRWLLERRYGLTIDLIGDADLAA